MGKYVLSMEKEEKKLNKNKNRILWCHRKYPQMITPTKLWCWLVAVTR